jgi:uncharacterized protein
MRPFFATLCLLATLCDLSLAAVGPAIPALEGPVVDRAGIFSAAATAEIERLARDVQTATGAELAVLTVVSTKPLEAFDYGMAVLEQWRLGRAGQDDGLLLLIVTADREVRFFPGYGLEGVLPDGALGSILDSEVVPALARGDYDRAALAGLAAVARRIGATETSEPAPPRPTARPGLDGVSLLLLVFVLLVIVVIIAQTAPSRRAREPRSVFWDGYPGRFGSGGFGRGGFGGGGFRGGGRFGGGGAGRRW